MNRFLINYMWEMLDVARANGVDVGVGRDMFVANLNNFGLEGAEFYPGAENMDYETASEQWKAMPLKEQAEAIVEKLRQGKYTKDAAIIGEVTEEMPGRVVMTTEIGAETLLPEPRGELLPRIC